MALTLTYAYSYETNGDNSPTDGGWYFIVNGNVPEATGLTVTNVVDPQNDGVFTPTEIAAPRRNDGYITAGPDGSFDTPDDLEWWTSRSSTDKDFPQDGASVTVTTGTTRPTMWYNGNMVSFMDLYVAVRPAEDKETEPQLIGAYWDYPPNRSLDGVQQEDDATGVGVGLTSAPVVGSSSGSNGTWYQLLSFGEVLGDFWTRNEHGDIASSSSRLYTNTDWNNEASIRTDGMLSHFPTGVDFTFGYLQLGVAQTCFLAGAMIATATGETAIEDLQIGDFIVTDEGCSAVKFISKDTQSVVAADEASLPICIQANALGAGLPVADLYVSPGHSMFIAGTLVHASALVNGSTIKQVTPEFFNGQSSFIYYNIELEKHQLITANGVQAESYFDIVPRRDWDNYAEYMALYGADKPLEELPFPVVAHARQLPAELRLKLQLNEQQLASV